MSSHSSLSTLNSPPAPESPSAFLVRAGEEAQLSLKACSLPCIRATTGPEQFFLVQLLVKNIQLEDGKMMPASHFFRAEDNSTLELTEAELATMEAVRVRPLQGYCLVGQVLHCACVL